MKRDDVVSLFSGAGGMSLGFARAGLKPVIAADIDRDACETYRKNLDAEIFETDIAENTACFKKTIMQYKGVFAVIGGPPCQGFSSAGRKDGEDKRNRLIFEYLSILDLLNPRWFLFENVEGLLTSNNGKSLSSLISKIIGLGYSIRLEKVNFAAFGLPQGRKRVVLIGNRLGLDFVFPSSTRSFNAGKHRRVNGLPMAPSLNCALAGLGKPTEKMDAVSPYVRPEPVTSYDAQMREENFTGAVSLHVASVPAQLANLIARLRPGETMKHLPSEYWHESYRRRAYRRVIDGMPTERRGGAPSGIKRLDGALNALTITSAATREFIHPTEDRPLTIRESARLQSFPDRYNFVGKAESVIRQIGNAFPPLAARIFAEHLMALDGTLGSDVGLARAEPGRLISYRLTEASGMSPALAKTDGMLRTLMSAQSALSFEPPLPVREN